MGLCWLVIIGINLAALWWTPPSQTTYLAAGVSILSAIIVWFLPGANPLWNRRRITSRKQQPNGKRRQAPNDQAPLKRRNLANNNRLDRAVHVA